MSIRRSTYLLNKKRFYVSFERGMGGITPEKAFIGFSYYLRAHYHPDEFWLTSRYKENDSHYRHVTIYARDYTLLQVQDIKEYCCFISCFLYILIRFKKK